MTTFLTLEDLLALVGDLEVGPIRDIGLLDSAAHRPQASLFGVDAYPTLDDKGSALLQSIVGHHPLIDGNKRLGWLALYVFFEMNGVVLDVNDDEAYDFVIDVASGGLSMEQMAERLAQWH